MFDASKNNFNESIPLTALPKLTTLLLDQNQLTGALPLDIMSWKSLIALNLNQNQLYGQIPHAIGQLPTLSQLDLSENELSGQVPSLHPRLTNLNLSFNHLIGRIPSEFEILVFASSFLGNSSLCADTPTLNLTLCKSGLQRKNKGSSWSVGLVTSLVIVALLLTLLLSLLFIRFNRKRKQGLVNSWKLISFERLNFIESSIVSSINDRTKHHW